MMERPMPDGFLQITFMDDQDPRHIPFAHIRYHKIDPRTRELVVAREGNESREHFPLVNIRSYEVVYNSEEYKTALKAYRDQHDHEREPEVD